jgi:hypothetical protein
MRRLEEERAYKRKIEGQKKRSEYIMMWFDRLHSNCRKYSRINGRIEHKCIEGRCKHVDMVVNENENE